MNKLFSEMALMGFTAAAMGSSFIATGTTKTGTRKLPLTKKQKKARAASKSARKARRIQRRKAA